MPGSCLHLENLSIGIIPIGSLIVIDSGKCREYDSKTDSLENVVGVAYAGVRTSGRCFSLGDGSDYYTNDSTIWSEDLTYQVDESENPVNNESYVGWNPYSENNKYTSIVYSGFVPVLKTYASVPSRWVLVKANAVLDWYLIR